MLEETRTKNTAEEYYKACTAIGLLGLISLLKEFEEKEDYEECNEILKALQKKRDKHVKQLNYSLPTRAEEVRERDLLLIGSTKEEQKDKIENQKQRIIAWLAK